MITVHTNRDCENCREICETLDEMVIEYELDPTEGVDADHSIEDEDEVYRGHQSMQAHVAELAATNSRWRSGTDQMFPEEA